MSDRQIQCRFCDKSITTDDKRRRYCSKECKGKMFTRYAAEKRKANPDPYRKSCKRYDTSEKGRLVRKRYFFIRNMSMKFKRYVKREMKRGVEFEDALKSVKRVIYTELAALDVEAGKAESIVGQEYERILENYKNRVSKDG